MHTYLTIPSRPSFVQRETVCWSWRRFSSSE